MTAATASEHITMDQYLTMIDRALGVGGERIVRSYRPRVARTARLHERSVPGGSDQPA